MNILRKAALAFATCAAISAAAFTLDLPIEKINGKDYYVYRVAPKETVYSITRKLGITRDELIQANPAVADGLRAGETLLFPTDPVPAKAQQSAPAEPAKPVKQAEQAVAKEDSAPENPVVETISPEEQQKKPGNKAEEKPATEPVVTPALPPAVIPAVEPAELPEPAADEPADTISVAIILPFMLENENVTKSAENYTNFYRGFLLAADSLSTSSKNLIKISAFDSEGSADKVAALVMNPQICNADFIIAPDDPAAINNIVAVADSTDAMVLNLFSVKNDAYLTHESLLLGNVSHDTMYAKAIDSFCKTYKDKNVIILNPTDIPSEKKEFTSLLVTKLIASGIPYDKIEFSGKLTEQNLAALTADKDYVFIPTSNSREMLMRILPSLASFKELNPSASLFGYPEWIVMQGNIRNQLNKVNTTFYSRFASDASSDNFKNISETYKSIYGTPMDRSIPNQTLLGFDVASWIMCAAQAGVEEPYQGAQNSFQFKEVKNGGFENTALYFINYAPDGSVEVILL